MRDKIVCLICNKWVLVAKEYNLRRHYGTVHKDMFGVQEVELREDKLQKLKSDLQRQWNNLLLLLNQMKQQLKGVLLFHKALPKKIGTIYGW